MLIYTGNNASLWHGEKLSQQTEPIKICEIDDNRSVRAMAMNYLTENYCLINVCIITLYVRHLIAIQIQHGEKQSVKARYAITITLLL